jgi:hypothetical protein
MPGATSQAIQCSLKVISYENIRNRFRVLLEYNESWFLSPNNPTFDKIYILTAILMKYKAVETVFVQEDECTSLFRNGVTSQKTWILISTAVRTSHVVNNQHCNVSNILSSDNHFSLSLYVQYASCSCSYRNYLSIWILCVCVPCISKIILNITGLWHIKDPVTKLPVLIPAEHF